MGRRQCPFCGKFTMEESTQCPFCREPLTAKPVISGHKAEGAQRQIRRGLVYMLLAVVVRYLVGGYSPMQFPLTIIPEVTQFLIPFLFLCGIGLVLFGIYRRFIS